jgi:predicted RNA-binding protein with PIN domain
MQSIAFSRRFTLCLALLLVLFNAPVWALSVETRLSQSRKAGPSTGRGRQLTDRILNLSKDGGIVLIDGDNVRGKTKFSKSKEQLCDDVARWSSENEMQGRVGIVFDHARQHQAFFLPCGLAVAFSGPKRSADDVISRDVRWLQESLLRDVLVVTEDQGLRRRCRVSSRAGNTALSAGRLFQRNKSRRLQADVVEDEEEEGLDEAEQYVEGVEVAGQVQTQSQSQTRTSLALNLVSSTMFVEMLYGNLDRASDDPDPIDSPLASITEAELDSVRRNLRATFNRKRTRVLAPLFAAPPVEMGTVSSKTDLAALLRREANLQRQMDNLLTRLSGALSDKVRAHLQVRLTSLSARLGETVTSSSGVKDTAGHRERVREIRRAVNEPFDGIVARAIEGSRGGAGEGVGGADLRTGEDVGVDGADGDRQSGVVLQGKDAIGRLLAEVRGSRRYSEETWERIILAERMRSTLSTHGLYSYADSTYDAAAVKAVIAVSAVLDTDSQACPLKRYVEYINLQ